MCHLRNRGCFEKGSMLTVNHSVMKESNILTYERLEDALPYGLLSSAYCTL